MAWGSSPMFSGRFLVNRAKDRPPPGARARARRTPPAVSLGTRGCFPRSPRCLPGLPRGKARDRDQVPARRARDRTWHGNVKRDKNALNASSEATRPPLRSPSSLDIFLVVVFPPFSHCAAVGSRGRASAVSSFWVTLTPGTIKGHLGGVQASRGARRFGLDGTVVCPRFTEPLRRAIRTLSLLVHLPINTRFRPTFVYESSRADDPAAETKGNFSLVAKSSRPRDVDTADSLPPMKVPRRVHGQRKTRDHRRRDALVRG